MLKKDEQEIYSKKRSENLGVTILKLYTQIVFEEKKRRIFTLGMRRMGQKGVRKI